MKATTNQSAKPPVFCTDQGTQTRAVRIIDINRTSESKLGLFRNEGIISKVPEPDPEQLDYASDFERKRSSMGRNVILDQAHVAKSWNKI